MPKYSTSPYLFDEEKNISISKLKEWGYLKEYTQRNTTISWSRNGIETSSISIRIVMNDLENTLTVNYNCNGNSYYYKIQLVSILSNLGKGNVWYFLCPFTNKRCRKLHLINEKFIHRSALPSGMYSKQTQSKKWRLLERVYGSYFNSEKVYAELHSKYFKTHYNGKPTKRYLKLMKCLRTAENISNSEIEKLYFLLILIIN
jgi:hypothetical protein